MPAKLVMVVAALLLQKLKTLRQAMKSTLVSVLALTLPRRALPLPPIPFYYAAPLGLLGGPLCNCITDELQNVLGVPQFHQSQCLRLQLDGAKRKSSLAAVKWIKIGKNVSN